MAKDMYVSLKNGFTDKPKHCFRCGDCCSMIPIEITQQEIELIKSRINNTQRKLFLEIITTDFNAANVLPNQGRNILTIGVGWIKAPCLFLEYEKHHNRKRAHCKIYKIRPQMCRNFFCGKESIDEHLNIANFTYKFSGKEVQHSGA